MIGYFYDIESLENVFSLVNYKDDTDECQIFYLVDNEKSILPNNIYSALNERIHKVNRNFTGKISLYNLRDEKSNKLLASIFGLSDAIYANNPNSLSHYPTEYRLKCDTDLNYNSDTDYYLFGYNSYHYDTTMLALYLYEVFDLSNRNLVMKITTAEQMRQYNDELFNSFKDRMEDRLCYDYKQKGHPVHGFTSRDLKNPKACIRKNMLMSGRHIDVARLNEKQQKVGLKRLLGMTGYQILESDKLKTGQCCINNFDEFVDLIAYNVSDCVNLKKLFSHKIYQSSFMLKKQLLKDYPELVYQKRADAYAPNISPYTVRNDRLTIDSSSAQFSSKSLCPYDHLKDYKVVSFMYPSEAKAKEMGIQRVNVLEESRKFFYNAFTQPELRQQFDYIYNYYKSIEGKNFNQGRNYIGDNGGDLNSPYPERTLPEKLRPISLSDIPIPNTCLPYFNKDGTASSCFVNFSSGGIHGAEYNLELYKYDMHVYEEKLAEWQSKADLLDRVKEIYPNPADVKVARKITIDEQTYNAGTFVTTKKGVVDWKTPKRPQKPELFKKATSNWNINKPYCYTSADFSNHEDFVSYYPNLLRMLDAFYNEGLGYDRYGEIFDNKTRFGHLMKDKSLSESEREMYSTMRNGTKLILNSASGAADATFESNILMNNKIISMRIIGQLFTWRIGQAQTLAGAKITSTNTDGLYSVLEETQNNAILSKESEIIHIEIEPEPVYLISKDTNNRMEVEYDNKTDTFGSVISASGGTLACRSGPMPDKSLAHPAIIDWALCEYLKLASQNRNDTSLSKPFNQEVGLNILTSARKEFNDDIHTLTMFQNMIASSIGTNRYVFATTDDDPQTPIPLQHYNRCFIVKDSTFGSYHLKLAATSAITPAMQKSRSKAGDECMQHNDPVAISVLNANGIQVSNLPSDKEAAVVKITNIEEAWYMRICNQDLHFMTPEQINQLFESLDYNKYLFILENTFEKSWRNTTVEDKIGVTKSDTKTKTNVQPLISTFDSNITSVPVSETDSSVFESSGTIPETDDSVQNISSTQISDLIKPIADNFSSISDLTQFITDNYSEIPELTQFIINYISENFPKKSVSDQTAEISELAQTFETNPAISGVIEHAIQIFESQIQEMRKTFREQIRLLTEAYRTSSSSSDDKDTSVEELQNFLENKEIKSWEGYTPGMYYLKKTMITQEDIINGKKLLKYFGVQDNKLNTAFKQIFKTVTNTDIK